MTVSYALPLQEAWARMVRLLLRPFDPGRWLVLGFTAWLAGFFHQADSHSWLEWRERLPGLGADFRHWPDNAVGAAGDVLADAWLAIFAVVGLLVALALAIVLLWLGSRGQFMFLDNLVRGRAEVSRPWREFKTAGDSLFLFQLVFGIVAFLAVAALVVAAVGGLAVLEGADAPGAFILLGATLLGTVGFVVVVVLVAAEFFLFHCVVPIMHRRRLGCVAAWQVFGGVFREHPGSFVLYGLLHFGLAVLWAVLVLSAGLMTCCVGLVLLAVPYVGTVLTLPYPVFLRYLDLTWLGQFGPDFAVLAPLPGASGGSGQFEGDGAVVGAEDVGEDAGGDEPRPQGP